MYIIRVLKQMFNGDLHEILDGKFDNTSIELVEVDFSNANLTGIDLGSLFVILTSFRNATLTNVDLSETSLRGSDFKNATFSDTLLNNSDWYNALNIEKPQFEHIKGEVLKCPKPYHDPTYAAFIEGVNNRYGISYEHYGAAHQQQLKDQWKKYSVSGGLCELADLR